VVTIDLSHGGTDETRWLPWLAAETWPAINPAATGPGGPLIVAPHPDDEILGAAGLLSLARRADLVAVTDGEASHPHLDGPARAGLARRRRAESVEALSCLGLGAGVAVHRLGHPDGAVDEPALFADLTGRLWPGRWCVASWRGDGHPDHEAVGRAAAAACAAVGARLLEYPVWMWHWAAPGDPRVPWERTQRLTLPRGIVAAKAAAIGRFRSQITEDAGPPVLPAYVLARFRRPFEVFFA
jgi:LmbE family N-acetylglucosaminyl deacetylase